MVQLVIFTFQEGDFTAKFNPKWIRKFDDMQENLTSRKAQVCDSRPPASFNHSESGTVEKFEKIILFQLVIEYQNSFLKFLNNIIQSPGL